MPNNRCFIVSDKGTLLQCRSHSHAFDDTFQRALVHGVEGLQRVCDHCYSEAVREGGHGSRGVEGSSNVSRAPSHHSASADLRDGGHGALIAGGTMGVKEEEKGEETVASSATIQLEVASKYTYFKGLNERANCPAAPESPPAGHFFRTQSPPTSPRRASRGFEGGDGSSSSLHWLLGGKSMLGGSSRSLRQEEGGSECDSGPGRQSADDMDRSDVATASTEDNTTLWEERSGAIEVPGTMGRSEGAGDRAGRPSDALQIDNSRPWDPRTVESRPEAGDGFARMPRAVLHGRLCAER